MGRQGFHPGLVVADPQAPEMIDLVAVLDRIHGAPAVHPDSAIGERNRRQLDAHTVHFCNKRLCIERVHIPTPTLCAAARAGHRRRYALRYCGDAAEPLVPYRGTPHPAIPTGTPP